MTDKPTETEPSLPTAEQLKTEVLVTEAEDRNRQELWTKQFQVSSFAQEMQYAHLRGVTDHYKHKGRWSWFLMLVMLLMVAFQSVLLGMVGGGVWDFTAYDWLLPLLLVQNFASIVGLAVWVVKSLFKDIARS